MARFGVVFLSLLFLMGTAIAQSDDSTGPDDDTTTTTTSTSTTTTTTPTTTTTTTTTTPETTTTTSTTTTTPTTTTSTTTTTTPTTTTPETTTSPDTTTETTTTDKTTTTTTTSTTTTATTTTPAPVTPDIAFSYSEGNVTCVKIQGEVYFNVNYTLKDNTTTISKVFIPSNAPKITGSCNNESQWISIAWDNNTATLHFGIADHESWSFSGLVATLFIDEDNFPNASTTVKDKELQLTIEYDLSPVEVSYDHSFICRSDISTTNVTAKIGSADYGFPVTSSLKKIQIEAFNTIANETDFVDAVHCTADNTSDVVPIAVGCALAGLVVIVLIAYLVGRRRRSGAYQSV